MCEESVVVGADVRLPASAPTVIAQVAHHFEKGVRDVPTRISLQILRTRLFRQRLGQ